MKGWEHGGRKPSSFQTLTCRGSQQVLKATLIFIKLTGFQDSQAFEPLCSRVWWKPNWVLPRSSRVAPHTSLFWFFTFWGMMVWSTHRSSPSTAGEYLPCCMVSSDIAHHELLSPPIKGSCHTSKQNKNPTILQYAGMGLGGLPILSVPLKYYTILRGRCIISPLSSTIPLAGCIGSLYQS